MESYYITVKTSTFWISYLVTKYVVINIRPTLHNTIYQSVSTYFRLETARLNSKPLSAHQRISLKLKPSKFDTNPSCTYHINYDAILHTEFNVCSCN